MRRLGYLLDRYEMANTTELESLRDMLTATYQRFDPMLAPVGPFVARWRLQLNLTPKELDAVRFG